MEVEVVTGRWGGGGCASWYTGGERWREGAGGRKTRGKVGPGSVQVGESGGVDMGEKGVKLCKREGSDDEKVERREHKMKYRRLRGRDQMVHGWSGERCRMKHV